MKTLQLISIFFLVFICSANLVIYFYDHAVALNLFAGICLGLLIIVLSIHFVALNITNVLKKG